MFDIPSLDKNATLNVTHSWRFPTRSQLSMRAGPAFRHNLKKCPKRYRTALAVYISRQTSEWLLVLLDCSKYSRVVQYSSTNVGPRADTSLLAVSQSHKPGGRLSLLSTRPTVTFPAKDIMPLAGTKLYCMVTEAHRCKKLAQGHYAMVTSQDWNPRPVNRKSVALPIAKPRQRHK